MPESPPQVTVLIAARPGQVEVRALSGCRSLQYPSDRLQVIIARGNQPSAQRNAGIRAARGDLIYFLDDDSVPQVGNLLRVVDHFTQPAVEMVGGPNLCPQDAPWLEQVFALVLASWLAFGPSRARYVPIGRIRETSEKELILCNLAARRDTLLKLGGFNESLYPNEENALMDQLQADGGKLLYDPEFAVHRRPRSNLKAFARMLMTYGRGRAEQFRLHPTMGSALNFVPPLFLVYLLLLPMAWPKLGATTLAPLGLYALALFGQAVLLIRQAPLGRTLAALPLIVLTHILYGIGFWRGLFTSLKSHAAGNGPSVVLETVEPL